MQYDFKNVFNGLENYLNLPKIALKTLNLNLKKCWQTSDIMSGLITFEIYYL